MVKVTSGFRLETVWVFFRFLTNGFWPSSALSVLTVALCLAVIFFDLLIATSLTPATFGALKHIIQDNINHLDIHSDASRNPLGFQRDRGFRVVVHIEQAAVGQILCI